MQAARIVPCLTVREGGLVKTTRFADPRYVGDPINAVRIFNDKEADELILLDITPGTAPDLGLIREVAGEAFMPVAYGGGIATLDQIEAILRVGIEKVVLDGAFARDPALVRAAAERFGNQSVIVCLDVRRNWLGRYRVVTGNGARDTGIDPVAAARRAVDLGAGEVVVASVDRDGTMQGYDLDLIRQVAAAVPVPVVALGGAGSTGDLQSAIRAGASASAAGALFVFHGRHRAVLITYPGRDEIDRLVAPSDGSP